MMAKMHEYPGFLFVNSDLYNHTPNLQVDILRDQAKLYGVSESRILTLLHDAYSQNYSYLIKKPTDQYQVILEVADDKRSAPEDLGKLYIKSDDGQRMVPLNAVTSWHPVIGPQAVNHINQFTSVTMFFNLKPGYAIGPATQFVETDCEADSAAGHRWSASRRGAHVSQHGFGPRCADAGRGVRHVRDPGDSLRELSAPNHGAVVFARGVAGRTAHAVAVRRGSFAVCLHWNVHADGNREEERNHDRRFRGAASASGNCRRSGDSRCQHGALSSHHDDDDGGAAGRAADCAGIRRRWSLAPAIGLGSGRRPHRLSVHNVIRYAGHLSLSRRIPGESAGPVLFLPLDAQDSAGDESRLMRCRKELEINP